MTRAPEHPPTTDHEHEELWENLQGESPDGATRQALNLAHRATQKFPELASRYSTFAGRAAIASGALMALAGVAVARRLRRGQQPEEILEQITPEEIEQAATVSSRHNRWWRMMVRIAKRRRASRDEAAETSGDEQSSSP